MIREPLTFGEFAENLGKVELQAPTTGLAGDQRRLPHFERQARERATRDAFQREGDRVRGWEVRHDED